MSRTAKTSLATAAVAFTLAACASTPSTPAPSPAEVLRAYDSAQGHTVAALADYQAAIGKATAKCTNDPAKIPAMIEATDGILTKDGITDETALTLLNHLDQSIPDGTAPMDCVGVLAAYATLREG
jgi:hypothetical protein